MQKTTRRQREDQVLFYGVPELQTAVAAGEISLRRAELIARLRPSQQRTEVESWVSRSQCRKQGQAIAVAVIRKALRRRAVDLKQIAAAIRAAVALADHPHSRGGHPIP